MEALGEEGKSYVKWISESIVIVFLKKKKKGGRNLQT